MQKTRVLSFYPTSNDSISQYEEKANDLLADGFWISSTECAKTFQSSQRTSTPFIFTDAYEILICIVHFIKEI